MRIYKLKFHSALHVDARGSGEPDVADEFIRSDTLSAALAISWAALYPDEASDIYHHPPFRVSSAFPYVGSVLLFPMPVWQVWEKMDDLERKQMKKARWLTQDLFNQVLDGNRIDVKKTSLLSGGVVVSKADLEKHPELQAPPFWLMTERQRVSVDRLMYKPGGSFFFAMQFFAPNSGLWFAGETDPELSSKLKSALDYLGDTGIGADRNSGIGHFRVIENVDADFPTAPENGKNGWITLSLYNPDTRAENLPELTHHTAYGLTTRSGWISASSVGRLPVRTFTEGSCFSAIPIGRILETLPQKVIDDNNLPIDHNCPRDFRAVALPCAMPQCLKGDEQ